MVWKPKEPKLLKSNLVKELKSSRFIIISIWVFSAMNLSKKLESTKAKKQCETLPFKKFLLKVTHNKQLLIVLV